MSKKPRAAATKPLISVTKKDDDVKRRQLIDSIVAGLGGSKVPQFNHYLADAVIAAGWWPEGQSAETRDRTWITLLAALRAFRPANELEGMIASQAIAMHLAAMECCRRAMIPEQPFEVGQGFRKSAANMSRAFVELLSALDRKRGKGVQQKVIVEHVHVHAGGKAIVGTVGQSAPGGGGGGEGKKLDEPQAPPAALEQNATAGAVLPPLRGMHPEREPVPITSDGERSLPNARRP